MVSKYYGIELDIPTFYYENKTPLWTIDLLDLLQASKFSSCVDFKMYTICVGIKDHHRSIEFYDIQLNSDYSRIQELFQKSKTNNWAICEAILFF